MAFLTVGSIEALFFVSALQGIAFGIYTPAWLAIFSRHLDPDHNALARALDSTTVGFACGASAMVGGGLAGAFGFDAVFIFAAIFSFGSAFFPLMAPNLVIPCPAHAASSLPSAKSNDDGI